MGHNELLQLLTQHASNMGIGVEHHADADAHGGGGYLRREHKVQVSPREQGTARGSSLLAHELGHAEIDQSAPGRLLQSQYLRSAAAHAPTIGALIAVMAQGSFLRKLALSAGTAAALQIPVLSSEMLADRKGRKLLEHHGASADTLATHEHESTQGVNSYLAHGMTGLGTSLLFSAASALAAKP